jgi:hypothetical protein
MEPAQLLSLHLKFKLELLAIKSSLEPGHSPMSVEELPLPLKPSLFVTLLHQLLTLLLPEAEPFNAEPALPQVSLEPSLHLMLATKVSPLPTLTLLPHLTVWQLLLSQEDSLQLMTAIM